jgi:outer membrane protein OmpA-like peptidoglycan-associated protein/ABC-type nitrate/sulfonate/bicarbonate transport system substrate-binding protein
MNKKVTGFILLIALGAAVIFGIKVLTPLFEDRKQKSTSDAGEVKATITIDMDSWVGYYPLCSPEMKRRLKSRGYGLKCNDDNADYPGRMERLRNQECLLAVATVDSYILNAGDQKYPGVIVGVIDESKGGDGLVSIQTIRSIDDIKKKSGIRIAFTPSSPSEHLAKSVASHFDVPALMAKENRIETKGSGEAYKKLLSGSADLAVLWEPDITKAVSKGFNKVISTENTEKLIVDILLANRDFAVDHPEIVQLFLSEYFNVLKHYNENPGQLRKEAASHYSVSAEQAESMLKGVQWINLENNARKWFGLSTQGASGLEGLYEAIQSTIQILKDNKDFSNNPLPDGDPYRIINSKFIQELHSGMIQFGVEKTSEPVVDSIEKKFRKITDAEWEALREVGTLRIRPITFPSGVSSLNSEDKTEIANAVETLKHYPNYRVVVKGHTGLGGDKKENKKLSQQRADAVKQYIEAAFHVDANRLRSIGMGSESPLPRRADESERAYQYRLPRVEMYLVSESL